MSITENIFDVSQFNEQTCKFIGGLVAWKLKAEWMGSVASVVKDLEDKGLNEHWMTRPTEKIAIMRACQAVAKQHSTPDIEVLADRIVDDKEVYKYCIYKKVRNKELKALTFNTETTATLYKDSGTVSYDGEFADAVQQLYPVYLEHWTADDIRLFIRGTILDSYGIKFREHGAAYIVPTKGMEHLAKLDTFLKQFVAGHVIMLGVPARHEMDFVLDSFIDDVEERIKGIGERSEKVQRKTTSLKAREKDLLACEELVNVYEEILGKTEQIDKIRERMKAIQTDIGTKMSSLVK